MHRSVPNDMNGRGWLTTVLGGLGVGLVILTIVDDSDTWLVIKVVAGAIGFGCAVAGARTRTQEERRFSAVRLILMALMIGAGAAPLYLDGIALPSEVFVGLATAAVFAAIVSALRGAQS